MLSGRRLRLRRSHRRQLVVAADDEPPRPGEDGLQASRPRPSRLPLGATARDGSSRRSARQVGGESALIVLAEQRGPGGQPVAVELHRERMPAQRADPLADLDVGPVGEPVSSKSSGSASSNGSGDGPVSGSARSISCSHCSCGITHSMPGLVAAPLPPPRICTAAGRDGGGQISWVEESADRPDRPAIARSITVASKHSRNRCARPVHRCLSAAGTTGSASWSGRRAPSPRSRPAARRSRAKSASRSAERNSIRRAGPLAECRPAAGGRPAPGDRAASASSSGERSCCWPSGTLIRNGRSMPSANTAAIPGGNDTTCLDCSASRFMVAPTSSRSSCGRAAGA